MIFSVIRLLFQWALWASHILAHRFNKVSLVLSGWGPVYGLKGDLDRAQWLRVDLGANKDKGLEAMLDSDMCRL